MYAPENRPEPGDDYPSIWSQPVPGRERASQPASHVPPPVPPQVTVLEAMRRPVRMLLRIPLERPILTPAILAVLVGIFLLMTIAGGSLTATENDVLLVQWGAKVNSLVYAGEWWRLITCTFLHAGFWHILFNGYALYVIGMDLEGFMGRARFAMVYAISGLAGSVASFLFTPFNVPAVGASGAIFGLIGALGVYYGLHRQMFGRMGQAQFWNIIIVIVLNLGLGLSGIFPIDNSAHVGGLLAGAAAGFVLCPRYALGDWTAPNVRQVININKGWLPWLTASIIGLIVIFAFVVILLLFKQNILIPSYIQG